MQIVFNKYYKNCTSMFKKVAGKTIMYFKKKKRQSEPYKFA